MNLGDTILAASFGALLGWLVKMLSDSLANWAKERRLVNRAIYQLYLLVTHLDRLLNNYSIWSLITGQDARINSWKSMFGDATQVPVASDLRKTALSLSEINPRLAFGIVTLLDALEKVLEFTASAHEHEDFEDVAEKSQMLVEGFRNMLQGTITELLLMRRYFRRNVSEKTIKATAERNREIEEVALNIKDGYHTEESGSESVRDSVKP